MTDITRDTYVDQGIVTGLAFTQTSKDSILHFKDKIAPNTCKLIGIEETNDKSSSQNDEDYHDVCLEI